MSFQRAWQEHVETFLDMRGLEPAVVKAAEMIARTLANGGKVMFCGNGGSAADSQHLAAELVGRFVKDRPPLAAVALTTDTSALTCIGNDYGFADVFARQVQAIGKPGDCLVGISTSGRSPNVFKAVQVAGEMGIHRIGLLGCDGGAIGERCDVPIIVPSNTTARIQEAHIFLGHMLCELIEQSFSTKTER